MTTPDPWQVELLSDVVTCRRDVVICASSQSGKTSSVSLAAYILACFGLHVLIVTPSDRQSIEFHERLIGHHNRLGLVGATEQPTKHDLKLTSGGRVRALPNSPDKLRSISAVDLLVIDEASRVSDVLFQATDRMLATTSGRTVMLSTPFGKRGFFYQQWAGLNAENEPDDSVTRAWQRHRIPWHQCPRISRQTVEKFRMRHGDLATKMEFLDCREGEEFLDNGAGVFNVEDFKGLIDPYLEPL